MISIASGVTPNVSVRPFFASAIVSGVTARRKTVAVAGVAADALARALLRTDGEGDQA